MSASLGQKKSHFFLALGKKIQAKRKNAHLPLFCFMLVFITRKTKSTEYPSGHSAAQFFYSPRISNFEKKLFTEIGANSATIQRFLIYKFDLGFIGNLILQKF